MSWDTLAQMRERPRTATENATETELAELCAATFGTPKGRLLLNQLYHRYVTRRVSVGTMTEGALREAEADRQFVLRLMGWAEKGEKK